MAGQSTCHWPSPHRALLASGAHNCRLGLVGIWTCSPFFHRLIGWHSLQTKKARTQIGRIQSVLKPAYGLRVLSQSTEQPELLVIRWWHVKRG